MTRESLGIKRIEALHYFVHDLERSRHFYCDRMDFAEVAISSEDLETRGGERSALFSAGNVNILVSSPLRDESRAGQWLRRHPDGVGTVIFEVENAERTFALLESRGGTPMSDIQTYTEAGKTLKTFSITTPFGSSTFRFVEREEGYPVMVPGMTNHGEAKGGTNRYGFDAIDHITSNFETMSPALLWMEHVMGFERYWNIQFHTNDVAPGAAEGSGLRSQVMHDPHSGVKFANNEPMRPFFKRSQIYLFAEDQRGDGIQHAALSVGDIIESVRGLREKKVEFFPTPGTYYDMLPGRIDSLGIGKIDEDLGILRDLEILVDGKGKNSYLLQIFLQDSAGTYDDANAGPFFFEIIQRKGDNGFGGGNFRALFESIERQQVGQGR